jgi:hypothetical protein
MMTDKDVAYVADFMAFASPEGRRDAEVMAKHWIELCGGVTKIIDRYRGGELRQREYYMVATGKEPFRIFFSRQFDNGLKPLVGVEVEVTKRT